MLSPHLQIFVRNADASLKQITASTTVANLSPIVSRRVQDRVSERESDLDQERHGREPDAAARLELRCEPGVFALGAALWLGL